MTRGIDIARFEPENGQVCVGDRCAVLTPVMTQIFGLLWKNYPNCVHMERLFTIWEHQPDSCTDQNIRVQISYARNRLREAGLPLNIRSRYGIGYRLEMAPWVRRESAGRYS